MKRVRWRMTVAWLAMGALVTAGFFAEARDNQARCNAGNEFRRRDLPAAFDRYTRFLGEEFSADEARVAEARSRFALYIDELFPERHCPLL